MLENKLYNGLKSGTYRTLAMALATGLVLGTTPSVYAKGQLKKQGVQHVTPGLEDIYDIIQRPLDTGEAKLTWSQSELENMYNSGNEQFKWAAKMYGIIVVGALGQSLIPEAPLEGIVSKVTKLRRVLTKVIKFVKGKPVALDARYVNLELQRQYGKLLPVHTTSLESLAGMIERGYFSNIKKGIGETGGPMWLSSQGVLGYGQEVAIIVKEEVIKSGQLVLQEDPAGRGVMAYIVGGGGRIPAENLLVFSSKRGKFIPLEELVKQSRYLHKKK